MALHGRQAAFMASTVALSCSFAGCIARPLRGFAGHCCSLAALDSSPLAALRFGLLALSLMALAAAAFMALDSSPSSALAAALLLLLTALASAALSRLSPALLCPCSRPLAPSRLT
ncbi:hypothetical protein Syun_027291 [Stephania yunnanensis]|uniref:Uncharacterized protein n=1 Tax=Stephania yunnanensis TaxID=152371 RepID=A0AAP0EFD8_9MAGN